MTLINKDSDDLAIAVAELLFQNEEKEKRAAELILANTELIFQNSEKEKRAAELVIANTELIFQNSEKEKRAAELIAANKELVVQNKEKEKLAAELIVVNKELLFQIEEKEKRAAELAVANAELVFQNAEKGKRAAELDIANAELIFQNEEKEKRALELIAANKELLAFTYISSHHLQEPLRKIHNFTDRLLRDPEQHLSEKSADYFSRIQASAIRMKQLVEALLAYSLTNSADRIFELTNLHTLIDEAKTILQEDIAAKGASIVVEHLCAAKVIPSQFRRLFRNMIENALKFSSPGIPPNIIIRSRIINGEDAAGVPLTRGKSYCHISIRDNGIGFEPEFSERIFEVFLKLHSKEEYPGTGIGLAIVKKIVENHYGFITATSVLGHGTTFDIYVPAD